MADDKPMGRWITTCYTTSALNREKERSMSRQADTGSKIPLQPPGSRRPAASTTRSPELLLFYLRKPILTAGAFNWWLNPSSHGRYSGYWISNPALWNTKLPDGGEERERGRRCDAGLGERQREARSSLHSPHSRCSTFEVAILGPCLCRKADVSALIRLLQGRRLAAAHRGLCWRYPRSAVRNANQRYTNMVTWYPCRRSIDGDGRGGMCPFLAIGWIWLCLAAV